MISLLLVFCVVLSHAASGQQDSSNPAQVTIIPTERVEERTTIIPKTTEKEQVQVQNTQSHTTTSQAKEAKSEQQKKDDKDGSHQLYIISVIFVTICSLIYIV